MDISNRAGELRTSLVRRTKEKKNVQNAKEMTKMKAEDK